MIDVDCAAVRRDVDMNFPSSCLTIFKVTTGDNDAGDVGPSEVEDCRVA